MENQAKILDLINQKQLQQAELNNMIYGSIEIRKKDNKDYIYTHVKEDSWFASNKVYRRI